MLYIWYSLGKETSDLRDTAIYEKGAASLPSKHHAWWEVREFKCKGNEENKEECVCELSPNVGLHLQVAYTPASCHIQEIKTAN